MEQVDRFELDPKEAACSTCTVSFADDNTVYFAVGTAFVLQDEPEPSKARPLDSEFHTGTFLCHSAEVFCAIL